MARGGRKKLHAVTQYATDVTTGKILASKFVRLACARHLADLKRRNIHFDELAANHIINFFAKFLVFYEGIWDGKPFLLEPFQKFIAGSLFGWKAKDGNRRFRTAYIEIGKGNGKTPLLSGFGLYGLVFDGEPGAEIYACATTREQAGVLFRDAKAFADGSPELKEMLIVDRHNIAYKATNSYFRPISSEHRGLDGKRPHIALIDEIHEHPNAMVIDKIRAGTKGRRNGMICEITNSGYDRRSICFQHHEYSEKILEGVIKNDSWFAYITGLDVCEKCAAEGKTIPQDGCPDCDSWQDETKWIKSNPCLGVSIPMKYLREQVAEASGMPSKENIVKRLNFNIWTESITKWMSQDHWNACAFPIDPIALQGRTCYGGLDLSKTQDLTAFLLVFPPEIEGGKFEVLARFFLPKDNIQELGKKHKVSYDLWERDGLITLTPGNIVDPDFIIEQIRIDATKYLIRELAYDPYLSSYIIPALEKIGFYVEEGHGPTLVAFRQGDISMSPPLFDLEKIILAKRLAHGGHPILSWHFSNLVVKPGPTGLIKPDKEKSLEPIDGMSAMLMAFGRAVLKGEPVKSTYEGLSIDEIQKRMAF